MEPISDDMEDLKNYCSEYKEKPTTQPPWLFFMAAVWIDMMRSKIAKEITIVEATLRANVINLMEPEYNELMGKISNMKTACDGFERLRNDIKSRMQDSRRQWEKSGKSCAEQMRWGEAVDNENERLQKGQMGSACEADVKEARCALQNYFYGDPMPRAIKELLDYRERRRQHEEKKTK